MPATLPRLRAGGASLATAGPSRGRIMRTAGRSSWRTPWRSPGGPPSTTATCRPLRACAGFRPARRVRSGVPHRRAPSARYRIRVLPGPGPRYPAEPAVRVAGEQAQPVGEAVDVSDGDQVALFPVFDDVAYRAAVAGHDRDAGCHRFDEGDRYPSCTDDRQDTSRPGKRRGTSRRVPRNVVRWPMPSCSAER